MEFWFNPNFLVLLCFPWTPIISHDTGPPITDELCENMVPNHNPSDPVDSIEFLISEDVCYNLGSSVNGTDEILILL